MERMISADEGRRLADEWKAIFLETSAKQNSVSLSLIIHCSLLHYLPILVYYVSFHVNNM